VNTSTDALNCGACGTACVDINGTPSCVASGCQITCNAGYADCDDDRANGCEKHTDADADNCGTCGKVCAAGNGTPWCNQGKCGVSSCPAGFGDCNADPSDGCEVDLTRDVDNCKKCGSACVAANGTAVCAASICKIGSCDATHADCSGGYTDGCETNIATDANNCGACNKACSIANASAKCDAKACKIKTCTVPWADCDGNGTDCETNTNTNTNNCGGCGSNGLDCNAVYKALNATGKCSLGGCQLDKCNPSYADCNLLPDLDGCEADLLTSSKNCGMCGTVCQAPHGSNTCGGGACVPSCGTAYGDCDGNVNSGCEAVFASDGSNCGSCGTVCQQNNASNLCISGDCNPTCSQSYFKSCDSNPDNGCEVDTRSSKANCGSCGAACQDNQTTSNSCVGSSCTPKCTTNHADCDSNPNNGCETSTAGDPSNCGACSVHCKTANASSSACNSGSCNPVCDNGWAACSNSAAGCMTSIDTASHCGNCTTACSAGAPFCVSRACASRLNIVVVNSDTQGNTTANGQSLTMQHTLANPAGSYRLVVVGVTGFGNSNKGQPASVQYAGVDMLAARLVQSGNQAFAGVYYLADAALPTTAGTYPVYIGAADPSNTFIMTANVVEFMNVEQASGSIDGVAGSGTIQSCSTTKPSDVVSVTYPGEYLYSIVGDYGSVADASPAASGQTVTIQLGVSSLGTIGGYLAATGTGGRTVTWNLASCNAWAHALISIKPTVTP